jgi:hypothetical protein
MTKWLVVLKDNSDLARLREQPGVNVVWDTEYAPVVLIHASEQTAEHLRSLPFVLEVEQPAVGSVML